MLFFPRPPPLSPPPHSPPLLLRLYLLGCVPFSGKVACFPERALVFATPSLRSVVGCFTYV